MTIILHWLFLIAFTSDFHYWSLTGFHLSSKLIISDAQVFYFCCLHFISAFHKVKNIVHSVWICHCVLIYQQKVKVPLCKWGIGQCISPFCIILGHTSSSDWSTGSFACLTVPLHSHALSARWGRQCVPFLKVYYISLTGNSFKERWYQHKNTFKNQKPLSILNIFGA